MLHAMYVRLTADEAEALHQLAEAERRTMRDQAALVLSAELRRRGLLRAALQPGLVPVLESEAPSCKEGITDGPDAA